MRKQKVTCNWCGRRVMPVKVAVDDFWMGYQRYVLICPKCGAKKYRVYDDAAVVDAEGGER